MGRIIFRPKRQRFRKVSSKSGKPLMIPRVWASSQSEGIFFFVDMQPGFAILAIDMARIFNLRRTSTLALRQRKGFLLRQLDVPADLLRASVVERYSPCGKAQCHC